MIHHQSKIGVLLTNLGTPDAPTPSAVRRYLKEFLSDPRVVELPRWLWLPLLNGVILNIRPRRSAALYKKIWTEAGSPLLANTLQQARLLQQQFAELDPNIVVACGMRYGQPSIKQAYEKLMTASIKKLIVLPLYPQYSATTIASSFDALAAIFKHQRRLPALSFINGYHDHPGYIQAIVNSIKTYWQQHGRGSKLLLSFHGLPQRCCEAGDPYAEQCERTATLVAEQLALTADEWHLTYQSQFGFTPWLMPATKTVLTTLARAGTARVDVVCPGFAADCLETLEEIDQGLRALFLAEGGKAFHYIPALNSDPNHLKFLTTLIQQYY